MTVRPAHNQTPHPVTPAGRFTVYPPELEPRPTHASDLARPRAPADTGGLSQPQLVELYRCLWATRRLEEHLVAMHRQGLVVGSLFRSLGQEATAVGCAYALADGDFVSPLIRDLGAFLVHGVTPLAFFRQHLARAAGPSGGRDMHIQFADPRVGILGPVSVLGAMVPVLAGCLLASRHKGERRVGLGFIGDGGSSTGAFFEGLGFAVAERLPMIMVIEANGYAYSTPTTRQVPAGDLLPRARAFGCTVIRFDGNDVLAGFEATRLARARALNGDGVTILLADTYRRRGHAEHDPQAYVPAGEVDDWAAHNDPVERYERFLREGGHADEARLALERAQVEAELCAARDEASKESMPEPSTLTRGVFADGSVNQPPTDTWFRGGPRLRPSGQER